MRPGEERDPTPSPSIPDQPGGGGETGDLWPGKAQGLTLREGEIIEMITCGLSNQEIAEHTFLSINSIKSYIRSSYRKMGVTSRSEAVLWGVHHDLHPDLTTRLPRGSPPAWAERSPVWDRRTTV